MRVLAIFPPRSGPDVTLNTLRAAPAWAETSRRARHEARITAIASSMRRRFSALGHGDLGHQAVSSSTSL